MALFRKKRVQPKPPKLDIFMKHSPKQSPGQMSFISPDWMDQLNPEPYLVMPAKKIPWGLPEEELSVFYHKKMGRLV